MILVLEIWFTRDLNFDKLGFQNCGPIDPDQNFSCPRSITHTRPRKFTNKIIKGNFYEDYGEDISELYFYFFKKFAVLESF